MVSSGKGRRSRVGNPSLSDRPTGLPTRTLVSDVGDLVASLLLAPLRLLATDPGPHRSPRPRRAERRLPRPDPASPPEAPDPDRPPPSGPSSAPPTAVAAEEIEALRQSTARFEEASASIKPLWR